ncbi:MAG: hypothetical protein HC923_04995 [Myxococcales bacterium]|nr:hypothetical protein [Myxococcales bacterium]
MIRAKLKWDEGGNLLVERFSPVRRFEHWLIAGSFILLILTGFPQKLDEMVVGHWLLTAFGGLDNARLIHRILGIIMSIHGVVHIMGWVVGVMNKKMRMTLLPDGQDVRDAWLQLQYYLGYRKHRAPMPKFDYRQKFEYMGMVLGGLVMIFSGLVLLYPALTARYLPGFFIPVAKMFHTSEAVLALLVLLIWHVYGSFLNPEVFPMDRSMFTGFMKVSDLAHHHEREYAFLFPEGEPRDASDPRADGMVFANQRLSDTPEPKGGPSAHPTAGST